MRILFWILLINAQFSLSLWGQEIDKKLGISFQSGIILEDGFVYRKSMPVLGFGISYKLNKILFVDIGLMSIYKTEYDLSVPIGQVPFNLMLRNTKSNFITAAEIEKISNVGIKNVSSIKNVKYLYLPFNLSLNVKPIRIGRSYLGLCLGSTAIYGSYKATRDFSPINITFIDGTVLKDLPFEQEIEFRNFIIGDSYSKLYYTYQFGSYGLNLALSSYNFFWSHDNVETYHLLALELSKSF